VDVAAELVVLGDQLLDLFVRNFAKNWDDCLHDGFIPDEANDHSFLFSHENIEDKVLLSPFDQKVLFCFVLDPSHSFPVGYDLLFYVVQIFASV
jgi:hypothetical protein